MPNDCWNYLTIVSHDNPEQLEKLLNMEFTHDKRIEMKKSGKEGIKFELWSSWLPDFEWLESLVTTYPDCWIKNEWNEEGGKAGVWIGGSMIKGHKMEIKRMEWDDICIEGQQTIYVPKIKFERAGWEQNEDSSSDDSLLTPTTTTDTGIEAPSPSS